MTPQFDNNLTISFFLWAENRILDKGQAYINTTSRLYHMEDSSLGTGYVAYAAPYKQWVYDSGVAGANIINSVSGNFGTYNRGDNGMKIDYNNGRVILNASVGKNLIMTGTYASKEINFYPYPDSHEQVYSEYTQGKYVRNPKFNGSGFTGAAAGSIMTPATFATKVKGVNNPFALGGMQESKRNFSLLLLGDSPYQTEVFSSLMEDAKDKSFPLLNVVDDPINEWGDTKSGYNYNNLKVSKGGAGNLVFVDYVEASKISDNYRGPNMAYLALCNVGLSFARLTS